MAALVSIRGSCFSLQNYAFCCFQLNHIWQGFGPGKEVVGRVRWISLIRWTAESCSFWTGRDLTDHSQIPYFMNTTSLSGSHPLWLTPASGLNLENLLLAATSHLLLQSLVAVPLFMDPVLPPWSHLSLGIANTLHFIFLSVTPKRLQMLEGRGLCYIQGQVWGLHIVSKSIIWIKECTWKYLRQNHLNSGRIC